MKFDPRAARNTAHYRKIRARFLASRPLCASCEKRGIIRPAEELDHIIPARRAPDKFWDSENFQGLCRKCHEAKTAGENGNETPEHRDWREYLARKYKIDFPKRATPRAATYRRMSK